MDERRGHDSLPRVGMSVVSNSAWTGRVVDVIAGTPGMDGAIRVAWDGDGQTMVPLSACSPAGDRVMVQFEVAADTEMVARPDAMIMDRDAVTVPIIEEQIAAETVWRDAGSVMIRLRTEDVPQTFTEQTAREELVVEQVDIGRVLAEGEVVEPRQEGDRHIIPIVIEEAVVIKRRILAHELVVTKRTVSATQTVETTVRRVFPEIESGALADRTHIAAGVMGREDVRDVSNGTAESMLNSSDTTRSTR